MNHLIYLSFALLAVLAVAEAEAGLKGVRRASKKGNTKSVKKEKGCKGKKCAVDVSDLSDDLSDIDYITVELDDGVEVTFEQKGDIMKKAFHGEDGNFEALNLVLRDVQANGSDGKSTLVFGSISNKDKLYHISSDELGNQEIEETLWEDYPPESDPVVPPPGDNGEEEERQRRMATMNAGKISSVVQRDDWSDFIDENGQQRRRLADDLGGNIDIMVVWTKAAECLQSKLPADCTVTSGTTTNMLGLIDLSILNTNTAYSLSGVTTTLRLVHAYREESYDDPSDFEVALNELRDVDGVIDDVHTKRIEYGADVVALLVGTQGACGRGFIGPRFDVMFSVTKYSCAAGNLSFAHEVGHNMGCQHDRGTNGECSLPRTQYGWRDPQARFRTVLAYTCKSGQCDNNPGGGCPRIQRFSTPDQNYDYNGLPLGDDTTNNVAQINQVKSEIAQYTASIPSPTALPTPSPSPTGCVDDATWAFVNFQGKNKTCTWVALKKDRRCWRVGTNGERAYESCCECPPAPTPSPTSSSTPAPTAAPTNGATVASPPTAAPTPAPTPSPTACVDDTDWKFVNFQEKTKTCTWVARNTADRCWKIGLNGKRASESCCICP